MDSLSPSHVVVEFYNWYIPSDASSIYSDDIYKYVERHTVDKFRDELAKGKIDYDYFTQSQDPDPNWVKTMVIQDEKKIDDILYMITLAFAPNSPGAPRLNIFLQKEQQAFQITKVESVD